MTTLPSRAPFLTFEGGEGAGKTTQTRLLADRLASADIPCLVTREPGGAPFAEEIRALCDAEDPNDIVSDDRLVELLREKGFDLARRTVAKYREAIGIGSSVQRRRQKKLSRVA